MLDFLSNYTTTIICTIIMIIIIKMIIPDGKNRKYILFICGLVLTLVLFEPILGLMKLDINQVFAQNEYEYQEYKTDDSLYKNALMESYEKALIQDITNRLEENGYKVSNVRVEYNEDTFKPTKIYLNLEDSEGYIQPVKIEVISNNSDLKVDEFTKSKIKEIIKSNYGTDKNNIFIERSNQK